MSENKKSQGSSLANSQGTNKSSNKLYHERNEESKMNVSTAISVMKNNIERYDEQINYIEFKDRHIFELDQKEIVGKLMIVDMRKGAKNE